MRVPGMHICSRLWTCQEAEDENDDEDENDGEAESGN
jgi:hypothetical protein